MMLGAGFGIALNKPMQILQNVNISAIASFTLHKNVNETQWEMKSFRMKNIHTLSPSEKVNDKAKKIKWKKFELYI